MRLKCWVVMGNDWPAAVFASGAAADEYILFRRWAELSANISQPAHWKAHELPIRTEFVPETLQIGRGKKFRDMTTEELRYEWFYWCRQEDGKSGAAAGASAEFRRDIESELRRRDVKVHESLVVPYNSVVAAERRRLRLQNSGATP